MASPAIELRVLMQCRLKAGLLVCLENQFLLLMALTLYPYHLIPTQGDKNIWKEQGLNPGLLARLTIYLAALTTLALIVAVANLTISEKM